MKDRFVCVADGWFVTIMGNSIVSGQPRDGLKVSAFSGAVHVLRHHLCTAGRESKLCLKTSVAEVFSRLVHIPPDRRTLFIRGVPVRRHLAQPHDLCDHDLVSCQCTEAHLSSFRARN